MVVKHQFQPVAQPASTKILNVNIPEIQLKVGTKPHSIQPHSHNQAIKHIASSSQKQINSTSHYRKTKTNHNVIKQHSRRQGHQCSYQH